MNLRLRLLLSVAAFVSLAASVAPRPAAAAPQGPAVSVRTLDRGTIEGALGGLDAEGIRIREPGADEDRRLPLAQLIDLEIPATRETSRTAPAEAGAEGDLGLRAHLVGGSVLRGVLRGATAEGLRLEVAGVGTVEVVFDVLVTLETVRGGQDDCLDVQGTYPRPASGDRAYDLGEDEYDGSVYEATDTALVMESESGRKRSVGWDRLRVAHLENELLEPSAGIHAEVELANGSRLQVAGSIDLTAKGLRFATRSLPKKSFEVPFAHILGIRWSGGAFVYASDLPFEATYKRYHEDPDGLVDPEFYTRFFGARVNRRPSGCPLRIGGRTFRHGFGVNSHSTIRIPLDGAFRTFQGGFGIDDEALEDVGETGKSGNVDARILADGKELWKATDVRGGEALRRIPPLDVKGAKELVLIVEFGKELMMRDRADWVDPILVRK